MVTVESVERHPTSGPSSTVEGAASLTQIALDCLRRAALTQPETNGVFVEERNVWQPDSWLLQRCWEALADGGAAAQALDIARLAEERQPLAPIQALHRIAGQIEDRPQLATAVALQLAHLNDRLLAAWTLADQKRSVEALILAAVAAVRIGATSIALTYLERLDQFPRAWDQVFVQPQLRTQLVEIVICVGSHPLTISLVRSAIRSYGDAGANFLQRLAKMAAPRRAELGVRRLMGFAVDAVRHATLTTLHSHRVAVTVLAEAGLAGDVLAHLTTIANIQDARRASGLALRHNDQSLLRQVKRPQANADVDFLVYTLQEAVQVMPVRDIQRNDRIELAGQLVTLGVSSDGWTAAGAASTLVGLGALKYAIEVVDRIEERDPTRSEGAISLIRGLLAIGEEEMAFEETDKALAWARSYQGQNPERATIWGLAEVFLEYNHPQKTLQLLSAREAGAGFWSRVRDLFQKQLTDDELRDNRLRMQAMLLDEGETDREGETGDDPLVPIIEQLRSGAPDLLDGEALVTFLVDGMLQPLLAAGAAQYAWPLLAEIEAAVSASNGDRHAAHVGRVCALLSEQVDADTDDEDLQQCLADFLTAVWQADVQRGIWQTVHGVDGSLSLLLRLEGAQSLETIARCAHREGSGWGGET